MLHLKSGVNYIGENRLLVREELSDSGDWKDFKIIEVSPEESYAANCVRINDFLLMPKGYPLIREKLLQEGIPLIELEMTEFQKMDGGLTCLSIRF
jgi:dimethylargininase